MQDLYVKAKIARIPRAAASVSTFVVRLHLSSFAGNGFLETGSETGLCLRESFYYNTRCGTCTRSLYSRARAAEQVDLNTG